MVLNERRMHSRFCGGETGSIVVRVRPIHRLSSPRRRGSSTPRLLGSITAASGKLDPRRSLSSGGHSADPVAGMTSECVSAFSRHVVPEVCIFFAPSKSRAQGRPGARCTRGLVCSCAKERAHEHTGSAGASRPSLRSGFTAYFVLSPVNGSFATVAAQILLRDLTPAPRRQDHTTSPYASCAYVSRIPRPPHPTARS